MTEGSSMSASENGHTGGITSWEVVPSPTDAEMLAVQGVYLVADRLPIEDARLIAAAPEMLEALYQCLGSLKALGAEDGYASEAARAAISKATGAA